MAIKFYSPVIFVNEIDRSKKFYTEVLNEEIEQDFGNNIMFKSLLSLWKIKPDHEIAGIEGKSKQGNTFELYFETEDIYESAEKIKANSIRLLHDIKTEPWGQMTIRFFDPDDHLVEIGESFNRFITRIYKETDSIEETSKKTGVHEDIISKIVA
jgi:catechol 2,3-dioxygenase-like lactoylglutathione lyase family enzyme